MSESSEVRFSVDREGTKVTLSARQGSRGVTFELPARAAGALAANLVLATAESGEGWETEFTARGTLAITGGA